MHAAISGALLRQARLERNWSQEGLCRGICAVSYLSKIEQGKVEASGEILRQLFARLSLPWYDQELQPWQALVNESYEAVFSCDRAAYRRCRPKLEAALPSCARVPWRWTRPFWRGFCSRLSPPRPRCWRLTSTGGSWPCSG